MGSVRRCRDGQPEAASLSTTYSQDYVLVANAEKGDTATIDFEGFDNGVAFDGGKGENFDLEIGSGSFVPGFEDQSSHEGR